MSPKKWAYLTLKLSWLKISAGTNMGPQNNTYLSVPGFLAHVLLLQS